MKLINQLNRNVFCTECGNDITNRPLAKVCPFCKRVLWTELLVGELGDKQSEVTDGEPGDKEPEITDAEREEIAELQRLLEAEVVETSRVIITARAAAQQGRRQFAAQLYDLVVGS